MAEIGEKVLVHLVGTLDDGREFQNTHRTGEPLELVLGEKTLLPLLEKAILDLLPGQSCTVRLLPEQAFGAYDDQLVQEVPADRIPHASELPVGGFVELHTRLGDIRAKVLSADDDQVVLDCNHELAGQALTYQLELVRVIHESALHRELHPAGCACGCDRLKQQIG